MGHASNTSRTAQRAAEEMREGAQQVKGAAQNAAEQAKQYGSEAMEAVQHRWEDVRQTASQYADQGRRKARELEHAMESQVQEHPMVALMAALGAGFAIGYLCKAACGSSNSSRW